MTLRTQLNPVLLTNLVRTALAEDIGSGDATTTATIPPDLHIVAELCSREQCKVTGLPLVHEVYRQIDPGITTDIYVDEGESCNCMGVIATISGPAGGIITGERTALNFLQRLSGIATLTSAYVQALGDSRTRILDTRKTTPGLRILEKYAVSVGGGMNHRMGLYDRILIKDNHIQVSKMLGEGGIPPAVELCRTNYPNLEVEVEVDNLEQLVEALGAQVEYILLDNMSAPEMIEAVKLRDEICSQTLLEASGGITLNRVSQIGQIGLDFISVGEITHSPKAIDIGLDLRQTAKYPET